MVAAADWHTDDEKREDEERRQKAQLHTSKTTYEHTLECADGQGQVGGRGMRQHSACGSVPDRKDQSQWPTAPTQLPHCKIPVTTRRETHIGQPNGATQCNNAHVCSVAGVSS